MFCSNCGSKIEKNSNFCENCGNKIKQLDVTKTSELDTNDSNVPSFIWGIVGALVPIAGLVLFITWKDTKPKDSKAAGIGALIYLIFCILLFIFSFIFSFINEFVF